MMHYRKTNKKLSVLIVDDNEEFVHRMIELLGDVDNISSIQTAADYNEAFRMLDNKVHDVVLLDISLPGKSGIHLLQKIQELGWNCNVIMITNSSASYYKQQCQKLGVTHFLDKSNEFELVPMIITSFSPN
ncbi:MAG: response regulator [Chitinophagaceae bacterium]|nr:MAG: response regulator [Chitinophagaceae bacterium]